MRWNSIFLIRNHMGMIKVMKYLKMIITEEESKQKKLDKLH